MALPTVHIEIVSDVVCPWCVVGFRRLEVALSRLDGRLEAEVLWQPFELNPGMPAGGQALAEHVAQKYCATFDQAGEMWTRLAGIGAEVGFPLDLDPDMRIYGTFDAHRLLWWAGERDRDGRARDPEAERRGMRGGQTTLALALFSAYFVEKRAVDEIDVLVDAAARAGFDGGEARGVLARGEYVDEVREAERRWLASGIRSVPAFVLDGRRLITGAQEVGVFEEQLEQVLGGE